MMISWQATLYLVLAVVAFSVLLTPRRWWRKSQTIRALTAADIDIDGSNLKEIISPDRRSRVNEISVTVELLAPVWLKKNHTPPPRHLPRLHYDAESEQPVTQTSSSPGAPITAPRWSLHGYHWFNEADFLQRLAPFVDQGDLSAFSHESFVYVKRETLWRAFCAHASQYVGNITDARKAETLTHLTTLLREAGILVIKMVPDERLTAEFEIERENGSEIKLNLVPMNRPMFDKAGAALGSKPPSPAIIRIISTQGTHP